MEKLAKRLVPVGIVVAVIVIGLEDDERASATAAVVPDYAGTALAEPAEIGRWTIDISLSRSRIGPLQLTTTPGRGGVPEGLAEVVAPSSSSHPWMQHEVTITNLSERRVRLGDTRRSTYLDGPADRALLGADPGCGYGFSEGQQGIEVAVCALYLDIPTLSPGGSLKRTITLFKGLDGMQPLEPGTFSFHKKVKFRVAYRPEQTRRLTITYDIERIP